MIGQSFKRKRSAPSDLPAAVRVVGQFGGDWTVTDATDFGETFRITPSDLATHFGAPPQTPAEVDEIAVRAPTPAALHEAMQGYRGGHVASDAPGPDAPESPEQAFARIAREQADEVQ
jgi:hypothetical protein